MLVEYFEVKKCFIARKCVLGQCTYRRVGQKIKVVLIIYSTVREIKLIHL